jgi:hypothetical protein
VRTGSWWGKLRERTSLVDLGIDCRTILKWIFRKWEGGVREIGLAQDRDRWRSNAVMILRVPYSMGNLLTRLGTLSF